MEYVLCDADILEAGIHIKLLFQFPSCVILEHTRMVEVIHIPLYIYAYL